MRSWIFALLATLALGGGACATAGGGGAGGDDVDGGDPTGDGGPPGVDSGSGVDAAEIDANLCLGCSLVGDSCCPADQACDLGDMNQTMCRDVVVPGMETATCAGSTSCARGYVCVNGGTTGYCLEYCNADTQCQGGGGLCTIQLVDENDMPIPGAKVCSLNCDPLTSSGCPAGWGCHLVYNTTENRYFTLCQTPGTAGQEQPCPKGHQDCMPGYSCFNVTSGSTTSLKCLKTCENPGASCPGLTGKTCQSRNPTATLNGKEYGACL